jgi:ubiquinol-cytochrome c reductase cytochrome c subunit
MRYSVRTLSTRRRHPLAGPVVLLLGLLSAAAIYAVVQSTWLAPASADTETASARDVEVGQELFLVGCASCHGKNAQGIDTADGGNYGPPLIGVGAAAVDFQVGTGRMPMAQSSQQAPRKAPEYTEEETRQLAAYVACSTRTRPRRT